MKYPIEATDEEIIRMIARDMGRKGGQNTSLKHGSEHYRNIQKIGVENRKKRKIAQTQAQTTT